ncbi:uncharacterized protein LOC127284799 isoform X4 [Leptopilina boulardi]|uniref:uncharacterized protein LOC127284799 isoform X4 n=1 Tax=Leptopilina boulardi TaxID=63433 RepID=UPI0021F5C2AB|nr:uncharacterized protein LOC127284799 isoform X4 [Leptopilina boulardi]
MFLESNWTWLAEGWGNMADLAERVDDLICSFDSSSETTMDTLSMLIFGWMLFGLVVLCVGKYVYNRFVLQEAVKNSASTKEVHSTLHVGESVVLIGAGAGAGAAGRSLPFEKLTKTTTSSAKSTGTGSASASGGGGGGIFTSSASSANSSSTGYVPPTPPVRKRLTRKTSGPLISPARSSRALNLPTATGADPDAVRWVNELLVWLHADLPALDELLATWVASLNDFTANSVEEHGIGVEFVKVLPETHPPVLSNIFCECDSKDDVTITCDCEATPALQLRALRQKGDKVESSHYRVNVNRFRARLNVICITEKLLIDLKCDGWPEIKVSLAAVGTIKKDVKESHLQEIVTEIVVAALRGTNVHLNLSQYSSCPRLWREHTQTGYSLQGHYDSMHMSNSLMHQRHPQFHSSSSTIQQYLPGERRLLVKIVKATDLGGNQGCKEPYCVVELDDPPQKNQTSIKKDTINPLWDEAFLFDVNRNTTEVLLELFDHINKTNRFLGLGIVGVEELLVNPSQRQIIPLQGKPYDEDEITGTLTVEFLLIEGAEVPQIGTKPYKVKETIKPVSPTRTYSPTNNLLSTNSLNYNNDFLTNGNAMESPYRSGQTNGNKGTLIVHSQQRQPERHVVKVTLNENGSWQEICSQTGNNKDLTSGTESTPNSSTSESIRDRGRPRRKRRDFFGTIKKRLSRSKTRSRSVGPDGDANHEETHSRSISADRARDTGSVAWCIQVCCMSEQLTKITATLSVPGREEHSRRSSLSEASGISGTSTRTYINEASTLILETLENGITKHYLVPLSLAQKSKWRKKGIKLHIFNDHTFIARHIPGGTVCQVCKRTLARRLGKQGYECRDCLMKCHKHCHVKVDNMCPSSTIQSIEMILIRVTRFERKSRRLLC